MKTAVIYGSTTGNNKKIAAIIFQRLSNNLPEVLMYDVRDFSPNSLTDYDLIVIGSSTWGDGDLQDDMNGFNEIIPEQPLKNKRFAVFGVGDDSWPNFCTAPDILTKSMTESGAQLMIDALKVNGDASESETQVIEWTDTLLKNLI